LREYGISPQQIATAIQRENQKYPPAVSSAVT
jgi:hypothetical protein